jgi:hypothetical protein
MSEKNSSSGIGIGMILFLIFMVLKLTGNIDWSWWWITAPLWIPIGFALIIMGGALIYFIRKHRNKF